TVEKTFRARFADSRANGEDVKVAEGTFSGVEESGNQQIAHAGRAAGFDVEHAEFLRRLGTQVEVQAAGVVILPCLSRGEERGIKTGVCFGRGEHQDGDRRSQLARAGDGEE